MSANILSNGKCLAGLWRAAGHPHHRHRDRVERRPAVRHDRDRGDATMTTPIQFDGRAWNTLGERGNLLAGEGWRYTRTGRVRHRVIPGPGEAGMANGVARCGLDADWYGTGSQAEYERLAGRPKCLRCES